MAPCAVRTGALLHAGPQLATSRLTPLLVALVACWRAVPAGQDGLSTHSSVVVEPG